MSQAKVERYKEEKKNRAKELKKAKAKKTASIIIAAAIIGAIIGVPAGRITYKEIKAKEAANATTKADLFDVWLTDYWSNNFSGQFDFSTATDAEEEDSELDFGEDVMELDDIDDLQDYIDVE